MAEIVARSSGAAYRLRWIREELSLSGSSRRNKSDARSATSGSTSTERLRLARPLDALRRASEHRESAPAVSELLRSIVVELCEAFGARRALAYRSEEAGLVRVDAASVTGDGESKLAVEPPAALLHEAISSRSVVIADDADALCSRAVLPVAFDDEAWGVICLERPGCGAFSDEDRYSLSALAAQATLTLQLSRRRRDAGAADSRARAAEELRAVTDFADSVARDLDGVFGAIHDSVESAFLPVPEQQLSVLSTTEKARAFVQRLEAFARHRTEEPRVTDLNEVLLSLEQVLRPLVRAPAELVVNFDPELYPALVDPWVLEQLLVSLTLNARRAMRGAGVVVLQSTNTDLDERASANRATPGPYSMISLASEVDAPRDPAGESSFDAIDSWLIAGYGTRIHAAGGIVSTQRDPGVGQTCRICLPARPKAQAGSGVVPRASGHPSVLLVARGDDTEAETLARAFGQDNFQVHVARDDALPRAPDAVVAELDPSVPELAQALGERFGAERVLFLSGHPKSLLMHLGLLPNGARFLQRPASHSSIVARIRRLLADSAADSVTSTPITRR
jgi:GAF domain-containing protein